jgi:hypothetical protein
MKTEIIVTRPLAIGGTKIVTEEFDIRNARLHTPLEKISRLMIAMIESRSNNATATVSPSEVRSFRLQWKNIKDDFEFAFANNDLPSGSHELAFKICLPHQKHILSMRNLKLRGCVAELYKIWDSFVTMDSANLETVISPENKGSITRLMEFVDRVMDREIGTGENEDNLGRVVADNIHLGEISPALNSNFCVRLEPSSERPLPPIPDTPDIDPPFEVK